jgi:hypothetical protein
MPTFNTTDPKPGYVYDSGTDTWFPLLGLATQTLDGLTDVIITTAATNQVLAYDGTNWVNSSESGDITAVTSGTGITVTNGTGPIPTIAIDTATTVDLSTAQTLTNKTLTAPIVNLAFNAQTDTTYTLVAGDSGKLVTSSNDSAVTITIPTGVFTAGEQINIQSIGVGLTTISGAAVTITSTGASAIAPILRAQYSAATIICTAAGVFTVIGDIA